MTGYTLLHYRIDAELGRGGMGIVYRATDTKLDRTVALKVLPAAALASDDDRARFYREAKAAAALNHPHIAAIYQIDEAVAMDSDGQPVNGTDGARPFIAMEYISGDTIQKRIQAGPMKLADATRLASEVADALTAAHAKGIVHRDIKSANIMLTADRKAKVLDFGLAQTSASTKLTRMGSTLGTVAYMSPEQARGEEVDGRSDLYSLGTVLYEMVTGRLPFGGEYEQAVVYGILNELPEPLTALRTGVPMELERITMKLLAKQAADRYQTGADLMVDLRNVDVGSGSRSTAGLTAMHSGPLSAHRSGPVHAAPPLPGRPAWPMLLGGSVIGMALVAALAVALWPRPEPARAAVVEIPLENLSFVNFPAMTSDGVWLAVKATSDGQSGVFLRNMATGLWRRIDGSDDSGDRQLLFSPDGTRLGYTDGFNGGVFVVVIPAGVPRKVTDFGRISFWISDTEFVLTDDKPGGGEMYIVDITGGDPRPIDIDPGFRPDGYGNVAYSHVAGTSRAFGHQVERVVGGGFQNEPRLFTFDVESGEVEIIEENAINPEYVEGGWLTYQLGGDDGRLVVRPVDPKTGRFTGPPVDVLSDAEPSQWGRYAITPAGDLLSLTSSSQFNANALQRLWRADLGTETVTQVPLNLENGVGVIMPRFMKEDTHVVFSVQEPGATGGMNVVTIDLATSNQIPFTFSGNAGLAVPSVDGSRLFMSQFSDSLTWLSDMPMDRSRSPERIHGDIVFPDVTPDGRYIVGTRDLYGNARLVLLDLETGGETVLDSVSAQPVFPNVSPDGRYVVYQSPLQATSRTLYVRSLDGRESYTVPGVSGERPVWSADGAWLYAGAQSGIVRIPVRLTPTFNVLGPPELVLLVANEFGFDVSGDGETLIVAGTGAEFAESGEQETRLVWVQNWPSLLERP